MNISLSEQLDPLEARNTQKKLKKKKKKKKKKNSRLCLIKSVND